ncbi:reverse transcriptase domain-containing protein [Tanacetum coccineum]
MAEGEIDNLTMEQYLALTRGNQAPGVVKPEIGGNLEEIRNFKQEGDETLYQAWEWYNDLLYKCPTHDINNHQKVNIFYNGFGAMNRQLLDSQGPIPGMTPVQALTAIQTMTDHSQKWHDGSSSRNIGSRCQNCGGAHLDKDCPLKEEVKSVEEVKYGEFRRSSPFSNGAKYRVGPPGYYTCMENRPPFREKRPSLEELMNKHMEESTRRRTEMEEWLTREFYTKAANDVNNSSVDQCKAIYAEEKTPINNGRHEISVVYNKSVVSAKVLPCQLPPKEMNPGNFTLPCTIGSLNFYAMADLGGSVYVIPKSMFEQLKLDRLKKTDMLVEMADMTKKSPIGIVENVLVKIDKFLFPSDFIVMDMLNTRSETMILGRPFLATIHVKIDVFNKEISLGIRGDRITYNMNKKIHNFTTPIREIYMINSNNEDTFHTQSDASSRIEKTDDLHNENNYCEQGRIYKKPRKLNFDINLPNAHFCKPVKQILKGELKFWPTCDPNMNECNGGHEIYEMDKEGVLRKWYSYDDNDRKGINGARLSFPEFLLVKYGENQEKGLI